jgi:hypothetical protein
VSATAAPPTGVARLAVTTCALAAIGVAVVVLGRPPAVVSATAAASEFSAERAMSDVRGLTASGLPHPIGSEDHARARAYVEERLRALGLEPEVQRANACHKGRCADVENVIARLPGREPGPALMLAAHYDSVPSGPGAADDGAGVATILEVLRALRAGPPPRRTVIALIDDGEEKGLLGARAFVAEHPLAAEVSVVLNFEARGTAGQAGMFETSEGAGWLVDVFAGVVEEPAASSLIYAAYKRLPNDTDLTVFKAAGKQGMNFAFADRVWDYHTARDTAERLDPRSLQHMGDQALAVTRALIAADALAPAGRDAVYFDLFSRALVTYPASWGTPLAIVAVLVGAAALARALRRHDTSAAAVARALGVHVASIAGASAAAAATAALVSLFRGPISPWGAGPVAPWTAMAAASVAAASALGAALSPRRRDGALDEPGCLGGAVALWTALALLVAWKEPGAGYLFTWPLAALGAGLLARGESPARRAIAAVVGPIVAAVLWFPVMRALLVMAGAGASPIVSIPAALVTTTAGAVAAGLSGRARWIAPIAATAVCLVAAALAAARVGMEG